MSMTAASIFYRQIDVQPCIIKITQHLIAWKWGGSDLHHRQLTWSVKALATHGPTVLAIPYVAPRVRLSIGHCLDSTATATTVMEPVRCQWRRVGTQC